jgi:ribosomal protein L12E/L44/L45/RPP1/RPP2
LYEFQVILAKYNAQALDEIGSFYFTKENYDNLSPIYGSTYPKFFGSVAATFEQASSRGILQESTNGPLTFAFTIRNHLATSFSTIRGAVAEKTGLFKVQKDFFKYALEQGSKNPAKAFVFGDSNDVNLTQKFLGLLLQHHVQVFDLADKVSQDGKNFEKGTSYIVPSAQPNFLLVHSIFEENALKDSIFYDNTGWSIIHAYGLKYAKINGGFSKGNVVTALQPANAKVGNKSSYAYLINSSDYNYTKALYKLQLKNVNVKAAFKPFVANTSLGKKSYLPGALVIPVTGQTVSADSLYAILNEVAKNSNVEISSVTSGFSAGGIDLGSSNIRTVRKPEVAVAFGQGVTASEAGQVWFLLNQQLDMPVSKIDLANFPRTSLNRYTAIVLPGGNYSSFDKATIDRIKTWVNDGGTLITFQNASAWAVNQGIANEKLSETETFVRRDQQPANTPATTTAATPAAKPADAANEDKTAKQTKERLDYSRQEDVEGSKRINGAIFQSDLDITHPIAFGLTSRKLFINKNGSTLLLPSTNKYSTVAQYTAKPFVNGYSSKSNIAKVANSAAIIASATGSGEVILFADDPTYRGYWLGTSRLFLNSIFFGSLLSGGR